jgi:HEAT repeat protein
MKNRIARIFLVLWFSVMPPAFAGDDWTSINEQINSIKGTYETSVAIANVKQTQTIYLELDKMRAQNESKFITDLARQPGQVQSFLCRYLASRKVKEAVPELMNIYSGLNEKTETPFLRDSIVSTVSQLDGANNRKFFLRVLPTNNVWVRMSAVKALSYLPNDHETIVALRNTLLSDKDPMVRRDAASALGNFTQDQWAKQSLEQALNDEQSVLQAVKISLQKFKSEK